MATARGKRKASTRQILEILQASYLPEHPRAKIDVYRRMPGAVRVRIIDPDFEEIGFTQRPPAVWAIIDTLPEKVVREITLLLLLTPEETRTSFMNIEFEHPTPGLP